MLLLLLLQGRRRRQASWYGVFVTCTHCCSTWSCMSSAGWWGRLVKDATEAQAALPRDFLLVVQLPCFRLGSMPCVRVPLLLLVLLHRWLALQLPLQLLQGVVLLLLLVWLVLLSRQQSLAQQESPREGGSV